MKNDMIRSLIYGMTLVLLVVSCDIRENSDFELPETFVKIYDHNEFDASFIPIDVKQTNDGGYLVLGGNRLDASDFIGVYLMKTDPEGNFVSEQYLPEQFVQPINQLMEVDGIFYFFCMESTSLRVFLVSVDQTGMPAAPIIVPGNQYYPLYSTLDSDGNLILQSYDHLSKNTQLSIISPDGSLVRQDQFNIGSGDDVEEPIVEHLTRTGKQLPFLAGKTDNNLYFFNGFYNFTISLVFTDLSGGNPQGVSQGQRDDGGISSAAHLDGSRFALSRFNFGDNYFLPSTDMATGSITSSVDLGGNPMLELKPDARVVLKKVEINGEDVLLYGGDTNNRQIVIYAYDFQTGEFLGSKFLGFSNAYELAGFSTTMDEGLVIAGTTYAAGRFARISLFKLSQKELIDLIN